MKNMTPDEKLLLRLIPEWRDYERRKRESTWVAAYLLGAGFTYKYTMSTRDARIIAMAYKALKHSLTT